MTQVIDGGRSPIPVEVGFDVPHKQRRLTVAFRLILMIPHFVVMIVFGILVEIGVIIAWFVALFIGRIPKGAADFFARTIQYFTRVYAYGYLLTDRYPPFGLSHREYPVSVEISSGRLNRLAVLFRLILQIPAYIVLALVGGGLSVAMVFVWLVVLVAGTMPASLFQAVAAVLRYQARFAAYLLLVTSTYPGGLFGDSLAVIEPALPGAQEPTAVEEPTQVEEAPLMPPASPPLATTLVLTTAAKRLVTLFLVLGVIWTAGNIAFAVVIAPGANTWAQLEQPYRHLASATRTFQIQSATCGQTQDIACEQGALRTMAAALDTFNGEVRAIDYPAGAAQADALALERDTDAFSQLMKNAATAGSGSEFNGFISQLPEVGSRFDSDFNRLHDDLI
jgi:hypothetical protein